MQIIYIFPENTKKSVKYFKKFQEIRDFLECLE